MDNRKKRVLAVFFMVTAIALVVIPSVAKEGEKLEKEQKQNCVDQKCSAGGKCVDGKCNYIGCPAGCGDGFYCENNTCVERKNTEVCESDRDKPPVFFYALLAAAGLFFVFFFVSLLTSLVERPLMLATLLCLVLGSICIGVYPLKVVKRREVDGECVGESEEVYLYARITGIVLIFAVSLFHLFRLIRIPGKGPAEEEASDLLKILEEKRDEISAEFSKQIDYNYSLINDISKEKANAVYKLQQLRNKEVPEDETAQLEIEQLETQIDNYTERISGLEQENDNLEKKIADASKQPAENVSLAEALLNVVLEPLKTKSASLDEQIDQLYRDYDSNKNKIADLEKQKGDIDKKIEDLMKTRNQGIEARELQADQARVRKAGKMGPLQYVFNALKEYTQEAGGGYNKEQVRDAREKKLKESKDAADREKRRTLTRIGDIRTNDVEIEPLGRD